MGREKSRPLPSLARSDIDSSLGLALRPTLLLPIRIDQPKISRESSELFHDNHSDEVSKFGKTATHILDGHPDVPKLTSIQQLITQAILACGEPATFDQIYEYVSSRWRGLRIKRRDGTPYTTDCRRAIQANLRYSPHQVALFIKVQDNPAAWRLSRTVDEALQPMMEKAKERDRSNWGSEAAEAADSNDERNDDEMAPDDSLTNPPIDPALDSFGTNELAQAAEAQWNAAFRSPNRPSLLAGHRSFMSGSNDMLFRSANQAPGRKALRTRYDDGEAPDGPIELTDLQRLISVGIVQKGHYAHVDDIYAHVAKHWNDLKNPNGSAKTTDCRRAVITSLTKNSISMTPIFAKGPKDSTWSLAPLHPWYGNNAPTTSQYLNPKKQPLFIGI
eukprot:TRINITY_DN4277_c0_g1_i2.p1 TRINITY_DN4277_c0_g1~~TRINITY_DN4277_c0_g1_i2.p1  ORF type:complete len:389 (-),score=40.42 TRINITY_DN4277_c0_g1_i2:350-1516(-)